MRLRLASILLLAACTPTATVIPVPFDVAATDAATPGDAPAADTPGADAVAPPDAPPGKDVVSPADAAPPDDLGAPVDAVTPADVVEPADVVSPADVVEPADVVTPADVVVPTDAVTPTDVVSPTDGGASCRSDRECAARNQVCDLARSVCVDCVRDTDCITPNTFCLGARCAPRIACSSSRMCPGQVCDTARMLCVDCVANNDCEAGQTCLAGVCTAGAPRCRSNTDCPGRVCDLTSGACVECVSAMDCGAGRTCRANACEPLMTVCVPNAVDCADATTLRRCNGDGTVATTMACPAVANGSGRCVAGATASCGFTCAAGFADCDGNATNGCEVSLGNNPSHCGMCNNRCAPAGDGGVAACIAGRCGTSVVCPAGRGDCDGNAANGCEVDLTTSAAHCGACGNACGAGVSCGAGGACLVMLRGLGGSTGFGPDANCMHPNDDGSWGPRPDGGSTVTAAPITLMGAFGPGLNFYGMTRTAVYLNNNGNLSFGSAQGTFTPTAFPSTPQPTIAAWWGDVDTRGGGQPARNNVCWFVESARAVFTWDRVGYYASHDTLQNSFQIVLRNRADVGLGDFDVEFRYERCQWTTGDASGGTNGFGGTPAQIGFDAGDRARSLSHPASRTMAVLDVCRTSNVGTPGVWRYVVRNGIPANP